MRLPQSSSCLCFTHVSLSDRWCGCFLCDHLCTLFPSVAVYYESFFSVFRVYLKCGCRELRSFIMFTCNNVHRCFALGPSVTASASVVEQRLIVSATSPAATMPGLVVLLTVWLLAVLPGLVALRHEFAAAGRWVWQLRYAGRRASKFHC